MYIILYIKYVYHIKYYIRRCSISLKHPVIRRHILTLEGFRIITACILDSITFLKMNEVTYVWYLTRAVIFQYDLSKIKRLSTVKRHLGWCNFVVENNRQTHIPL